jgi:hypothetical protein
LYDDDIDFDAILGIGTFGSKTALKEGFTGAGTGDIKEEGGHGFFGIFCCKDI